MGRSTQIAALRIDWFAQFAMKKPDNAIIKSLGLKFAVLTQTSVISEEPKNQPREKTKTPSCSAEYLRSFFL
jgi:hypothetical protein